MPSGIFCFTLNENEESYPPKTQRRFSESPLLMQSRKPLWLRLAVPILQKATGVVDKKAWPQFHMPRLFILIF